MIARLVTWAAAVTSFFFAWQAFCWTADGDTEFGAILLSLSLLLTGVCCVAGGLTRADLTHSRIRELERELRDQGEDLEWWKTQALARVDEVAWSRVQIRDLQHQLERETAP